MSWAAACCLALAQAPTPAAAQVRALSLPEGERADAVTWLDADGDGTREWLLATHREGRPFARKLEHWGFETNGQARRRDELVVTPDVVAFAVADVHAAAGQELLLFNAGGVFVWRLGPEARPERLFACDLLWQAPEPDRLLDWSAGVRDLDGDGWVDLIVPEPDGYALALQRRDAQGLASFALLSRAQVPAGDEEPRPRTGASRRGASFRIDLGVGPGPRPNLLSHFEELPAPALLDWNADGRLDLIAQTRSELVVWPMNERGEYPGAPEFALALPVAHDEGRSLDISFSSHAVDLDRDRRADWVVFAGDKRSENARTQALFFTQAKERVGAALFGDSGRPSNVLAFAGFLSDPRFRDLDDDGFPELIVRTVRPDLIDQLRSASTQSIDSDLHVFRNRAGQLGRSSELVRSQAIPLERFELTAEFLGDLTGDGLSEFLAREKPGEVAVYLLRAAPGKPDVWALHERPLWSREVHHSARVVLAPPSAGARASFFVLEPSQVLGVSFP